VKKSFNIGFIHSGAVISISSAIAEIEKRVVGERRKELRRHNRVKSLCSCGRGYTMAITL